MIFPKTQFRYVQGPKMGDQLLGNIVTWLLSAITHIGPCSQCECRAFLVRLFFCENKIKHSPRDFSVVCGPGMCHNASAVTGIDATPSVDTVMTHACYPKLPESDWMQLSLRVARREVQCVTFYKVQVWTQVWTCRTSLALGCWEENLYMRTPLSHFSLRKPRNTDYFLESSKSHSCSFAALLIT